MRLVVGFFEFWYDFIVGDAQNLPFKTADAVLGI